MNPASNLFLVGPMGAGKSTIGRRLAARFGLEFVDLDAEIERRAGASVNLIFEMAGEAGFRERESALLAEFAARDGLVLAAANRALLGQRGFVVYLKVGVAQQLARLARDTGRPLLKTADRRQRLEALAAERGPLYREIADLEVESAPSGAGAAAQRIAALVEQRWVRSTPREGAA